MSFAEIKTAIDAHGRAFDAFTKRADERLDGFRADLDDIRDRVEGFEAKATTLPKHSPPAPEWKTFHTPHGPILELPAHVRMADAIPAEKAPAISFDRWLGATMAGERSGDKEALAFCQDRKSIATTSTGVLIPEEFQSAWIDLIRANMVLNAAGMTTVTMNAKTQNASAVASDPAATWHTEAASINAANPTFAARTLTAQTLVVRCQATVEVSQDSPDFGQQLAAVMAKAMATELDRVGLEGSGTPPEPQGILGASGVGVVSSVGTPTDYSDLLSGVRTLLDANVPLEVATANVVLSPGAWAHYEGLATGISSDKTQLPRPRALENTAFRITSNITEGSPIDSTIYLGDFRDLVLGIRREASVESLKLTTYASNLLLEFVGYLRADYMIRRPSSFVTLTGVTY